MCQGDDFENDAWNEPGVVAVVFCVAVIIATVVAGVWLDAHPDAVDSIRALFLEVAS